MARHDGDDAARGEGVFQERVIDTQRDLVYGGPSDAPLSADAYLPRGDGPHPALLLIHGGGFIAGSKESYAGWGQYLASNGIAAFAIDYSLASSTEPSYPRNLLDAKAAVTYLRAAAADLKVDPNRIGAMGGSAGGYLAAMLALTGDHAEYRSEERSQVSDKVSIVVPIAGLYDLIRVWEHDQLHRPPGGHTELHIGGTPTTAREAFYRASPLYHASEDNARGTKWLVVWGTRDDVVPPQTQSEELVMHLKRAGALVRTVAIEGAPHFWYLERPHGPVDEAGSYTAFLAPRLLTFLKVWCGW